MYEILEENIPEEELKRADHLVYVSLKYTRTTDIMLNAMKRMIAAFELSMIRYLEFEKKNKKISTIPLSKKERTHLVKDLLGTSVSKYLMLYFLLKKIEKSEYTSIEEFRKNVTLKTKTTRPIEVKVNNLYEYLDKTKEFINFINKKTT
ncbi:hypothetical protein J4436_01540 [Candidatus Woesearchaeota archaeon]|nr:hypothetical protein [Candidatus Woesearchaeota archaeon]